MTNTVHEYVVIVCPRVIDVTYPAPGNIRIECWECRGMLWLGPGIRESTFEQHPDPRPMCIYCARMVADAYETQIADATIYSNKSFAEITVPAKVAVKKLDELIERRRQQ